MKGVPALKILTSSLGKSALVANDCDRRFVPMKSFHFRSSMSGCSGSKPLGGRLSLSPSSSTVSLNFLPREALFHAAGSATMCSRIARSAFDSGRQIPMPAKMEPGFWANSLKADIDSLNRLKEGGMEVVPVSDAMMTDIRAKTAPQLDAFLKRVPAADKPVRAYLAEMKR